MRKLNHAFSIFLLMLLISSLFMVTAYADARIENERALQSTLPIAEDKREDDMVEDIPIEGIVMDASGTLWYMPQQIPLTFLSEEERSLIYRWELYAEIEEVLVDNRTNQEIIWDYWYYKTGNAYGTAGLMGNMQAESGFNPMNLQGRYERSLHMTDESYTKSVDDGTYTNFVRDSAGYGLVQWTYWKLKADLYDYAKARNTSIGNIYMQLDFLYDEFTGHYEAVGRGVSNARSIKAASNIVLLQFERPSDQSEGAQNRRANLGQQSYDACKNRCEMVDELRVLVNAKIANAQAMQRMFEMHYNVNSMWNKIMNRFYTPEHSPILKIFSAAI